ncbi:MAG TPA: exo-alpha-sialidase [Planctomycetota bacterium]|jgi:hypothetical protein|nr:exo-alpha-sialidase [Planctomycetota bacterium]
MSNQFFAATRKGLFLYERKKSGWEIVRSAFLGDPVNIVLPVTRQGKLKAVFAAVGHEQWGTKMHRSLDGGKTFKEIGTPEYPKPPKGTKLVRDPMRNKDIEWKLQGVWALEAGHPKQPQRLWCGTLPGGLFTSDDFGKSWKLNRVLWDRPERAKWFGGGKDTAGIHSICVDPRRPGAVTLALSCGGVWNTIDDGKTWSLDGMGIRNAYMPPGQEYDQTSQDVHRLVRCPVAPDRLWAQHHNGIFVTSDNSKSYIEIKNAKPSEFGFAVAVHPKEPDTAWFVPGIKDVQRFPVNAKLAVSRTRDGGKTFEVLTKGLPQKHAYDVVYRHALDVDNTGNMLAFGSTTGNLYVTENGGDRWQNLSTNLPPVYQIYFVK